MFRTFWLRSLKSALIFAPSARRLRPSRPRAAHHCFFRPELELLEQRQLLSTMAVFDRTLASLSLFGDAAGSSVEVEGMANGSIGVIVNGQLVSSANTAALRQIRFSGGGSADALTLNNMTGRDLTVSTDGSVILTGNATEADRLSITAQSLTVEGTARAASLSLSTAGLLNIDANGNLSAQENGSGGSIAATADNFINVGQVRADGAKGGSIAVTARDYLNAGTLSADGAAGSGGTVQVNFTHSYIDTQAARTTASGSSGAGGQVSIDGGGSGRLFSSGTFDATGTSGGKIDLFGQNIFLVAASADVSGATGSGGRIRIGGDYQGNNPRVPNAQTVDVTGATALRANAGTGGAAGRVIVWSQRSTAFSGSVSAKGSGAGGFIEVSSHEQLTYGGNAEAGKGGTLLLDPKNLVINAASDTPPGVFPQFDLIAPGGNSGYFGAQIVPLRTGNIVVTDPVGNGGAVYLFNGQTGALISALTGLASNGVGATATALTNGNYIVDSPDWNGGVGAVTWGSGTMGVSGTPSASNSLVGSTGFDHVGGLSSGGVVALNNGNYVVDSPTWGSDGSSKSLGAVTWGNGTTGISGVVSAANSLVGSNVGDDVGLSASSAIGVTALTNGNYVVDSPQWGSVKGAVTWGNGAIGTTGVVSAANSLVGGAGASASYDGDEVGFAGVTALTNGNYVVDSWDWNAQEGAVTWGNGMTGISGIVSASNSLVGSNAATQGGGEPDVVGEGGVTALTNGNYVVASPQWSADAGNGAQIGAVTWGSGSTGISGAVSTENSLVGSNALDQIGGAGGGVTALANGNYVVDSLAWGATLNTEAGGNIALGAVTWENGTMPATGTVTAANSLVGYNPGAQLGNGGEAGAGGVTALANGNYVVDSPGWDNSPTNPYNGLGAVTWCNGKAQTQGVISAANSLVGSLHGDQIGGGVTAPNNNGIAFGLGGGVFALTNGNYVVGSPAWNAGTGAVTQARGDRAISGTISASNSLIGDNPGDEVGGFVSSGSGSGPNGGGVTILANGNYVVLTPNRATATWGNGATGTDGKLSTAPSLGGVSGLVFGITPLPNGNYVVVVNNGQGNETTTWVDGTNGTTLDGQNTIDTQNSAPAGGALPIGSGDSFVLPSDALAVLPDGSRLPGASIGTADPNLLTYAFGQGQTMTVTPDFITHTLNAGTNVTLQASNDITLNDPITEAPTGTAGNLTLQAGRSILLNASINTAGGNLTLIANDSKADGVVDGDRDPGNAAITMASGVALNAGAGKLSVDLKNSSDKTNNGSGVVTLLGITAGATTLSGASTLGISINGTNPGSYTEVNVTGPINLNGASLSVVHSASTAAGSSFVIVQSTGGISGTFAGLSEGATVTTSDGTTFTISYQGNGGKEVVLTQAASQPPAFTSPTSTSFTVSDAGTFTVTASGSPAPTLSLTNSANLPNGVSFNPSTGVLSGTPAAGSGGFYTLRFTAANSAGSVNQTFTLTVIQPPEFTSAASATFAVGTPGTFTVTAGGFPSTPTLSESSSDTLPSGVLFNATTGVLSGTPAAGSSGVYTLHFTASSSAGSAGQTFTLTVNPVNGGGGGGSGGSGGGGGGGNGGSGGGHQQVTLNVPPLLSFFDSLLGGVETINANGTETIVDSFFGIPLLVSTFDSSGKLVSVDLFGFIDVTFLFA